MSEAFGKNSLVRHYVANRGRGRSPRIGLGAKRDDQHRREGRPENVRLEHTYAIPPLSDGRTTGCRVYNNPTSVHHGHPQLRQPVAKDTKKITYCVGCGKHRWNSYAMTIRELTVTSAGIYDERSKRKDTTSELRPVTHQIRIHAHPWRSKRDGTEDDKEEYNEKVEEGSNKVSLRFSQLQTEHGLKTYLNRSSRPWKRKDRSIPQVCLPNASSMVSISVHAESANCALSASGMLLSVRLRMQLFHNNIARI